MDKIKEWCQSKYLAIGMGSLLGGSSLFYAATTAEPEHLSQIMVVVATMLFVLYEETESIEPDLSDFPVEKLQRRDNADIRDILVYLSQILPGNDYRTCKAALAKINPYLHLQMPGKDAPLNKMSIPVVLDEYNYVSKVDIDYYDVLEFYEL